MKKYIDDYLKSLKKDRNDIIFIKDYHFKGKGVNTEILIEHASPFNGYNEIFCNISGKSQKIVILIPETYRDYAILK